MREPAQGAGAGLPEIQLAVREGVADFSWGHPDPALLPATGLAQAAELTLSRHGRAALSYGAEQGPGRLIEQISAWLARREGLAAPAGQVFVTGGVSQGLDLLCGLLTPPGSGPGDVMLVEQPVYHLALRIFRDHGLAFAPVASDDQGLIPEALAEALAGLRAAGRTARLLYTVPTFNNPTGATLPIERRRQVAALADQAGLTVLEDDVYHELWYDEPAPPALFHLAPPGRVIRLGSFSKVLAPGLRLGWLLASPEVVRQCVGCGLIDSGGGINHFTASVVATYMAEGQLDPHVERLRAAYRDRRDALLAALDRYAPPQWQWSRPGGGFFVWLRLPTKAGSQALLSWAESNGVSFVPGPRFWADGAPAGAEWCRLSFSYLPVGQMAEGVRRLAELWTGLAD